MSFLTPMFLAGLGLLAVPIVIHLTQRQQSKVTAFPSLMFLRQVPFRTSNRRRIRNPLLFALRCLALILVSAAFARPFLTGSPATAAGESTRDMVLLLDTSHSLGYAGTWGRALDAASEALDALAPGDRAALVTFSDRARERVPLSEDLVAVRAALAKVTPGARATRFDPGLQLAGRILAESDRPTREVIMISDFQRTGWADGGRTRLPEGVALTPIDLSDPNASNVAVADVTFQPDRNGRVRVVARVANMGSAPIPELAVSLELDGRAVGSRQATVPRRGVTSVSFERIALPPGSTRGEVRIERDDLAGDDALRFVAAPDEGVEVVLLEGSAAREDRSLFLERALSIGDDPVIRVSRRRSVGLEATWLTGADVVILNDADVAEGRGARALLDWVRGGGGLIVLLGPRAAPGRWPQAIGGLLGIRPGGVEDRSGRGGSRLGWIDYDHAVFELFSAPRSGDFSEARFFRFQRVEPHAGTSVLARYEDGEPALTERIEGGGRVMVWTSTLDRFWNDLALQPVYLPFVHRLVRHASQYRYSERWVPVGRVAELGTLLAERGLARPEAGALEWVVVAPGGERRSVRLGRDPVWLEFEEAGFYELRPLGDEAALATVAVNPSLEESDLTALAPERLAESVAGGPAVGPAGEAGVRGAGNEETYRNELWWPLLLAAALVLLTESLVANRWARRRVPSRRATPTG